MALHIFVSIYARAVDDDITFYIVHHCYLLKKKCTRKARVQYAKKDLNDEWSIYYVFAAVVKSIMIEKV